MVRPEAQYMTLREKSEFQKTQTETAARTAAASADLLNFYLSPWAWT